MSQNKYMAVSLTETKADTKKAKSVAQNYRGAVDASVEALNREFGIYKRENEIEMDELRTKIRLAAKSGGSGEAGKDGVGIKSIEQTVTSTESGGENKIEITLTNDQKEEFTVRNGEKGDPGTAENVTPESIGALPVNLPSCPTTSVKDVTTTGRYYCWGCTDLPQGVGTYGYLEVFIHPTTTNHRYLRYTAATEEGTWECSTFDGSTWTEWRRLATTDTVHMSKSLVGNEDLNTITDEGEYYYGWWQETIQNSPVHSAFHLSVERISADEVSQTYTVYTGGNNEVWFRQSNNGKTTWSAWKKIATADQIPTTADAVGAVKKSGDTMTGHLSLPSLKVTNFGTPLEMGKYLDMHDPNNPDDDFSVRLIADGDTLKMHRKGTGYYDTFYHDHNKPTAADVGARPNTWLPTPGDIGAIDAYVGVVNGTDIKFDTAFKQGEYSVTSNNNTDDTPPYNLNGGYAYGKLIVTINTGDEYNGSWNWMWQTYYPTSGGAPYIRSRINNGAFSSWQRIATTDYIDEQILKGEW